jgi:hypothetical protein
MAWRIEHNVVRGEIDNRIRAYVEGRIWLAGRGEPLVLRLNGNCHIDLAGCRLEFSNPKPSIDSTITLSPDQSGVVGDITAARRVRWIEAGEYEALKGRKKPPERIANALYLEWFSEANGRVVIESTEYKISVSVPAWRMSHEEEARQREANVEAMESFLDRQIGTPDAREEAVYSGAPEDEFEWELFLRASDRRAMKLGELLDKYRDSPDCDRIIAKAMGWTEIEEMLEAEAELESENQFPSTEPFLDSELMDGEVDTNRHPLVARLLERSTMLVKLVHGTCDPDIDEMVAGFMSVGPKVAGALVNVMRDSDEQTAFNGLAVAKLKRAVGELSRALNAASRLKQRSVDIPVSIDEWITEMLKIREELLLLMNEFRCR